MFCYCRSVLMCVFICFVFFLGSLLSTQFLSISRISVVVSACLCVCKCVLMSVYVCFN